MQAHKRCGARLEESSTRSNRFFLVMNRSLGARFECISVASLVNAVDDVVDNFLSSAHDLDRVLKMSSSDTSLPPTLQSALHPFTASDALPSEPTHPFSNAEKPWSTLNDIFAATSRISESLNAYLSFPLENTKLTSLLRQHTTASHSLNLVRIFLSTSLHPHSLTIVRQNTMLARPSKLCGRRSVSGTAQTCPWTRQTS